ncbi:MAG: FkbM family methyltransferase [Bacteroidales bacterium]
MSIFKMIVREALIIFHADITKNLKYDRLTRKIMKRILRADSICIDVGSHKGEILKLMFKYSAKGTHYAFEPIPYLYKELKRKYNDKAKIFSYALSDITGESIFHLVKNAPAYSGIKERRYDIASPEIEEIKVEQTSLDLIIPKNQKVDFIKIDVEGGELNVMKGAKNLLKTSKPTLLFESGKGSSDYYGTSAIDLYSFITEEIGLKIYTLNAFIQANSYLSKHEFENHFNTNSEYYFIAASNTFNVE